MEPLDPMTATREEAIARIHDAGITGMGGASFPTHVKFNYPATAKIDHLIINAAECEPYLTIDESVLNERANTVLDGIRIAQHIVKAPAIIAIEKNKAFLLDSLNAKNCRNLKTLEYKIEVCIVKTKYPQGAGKKSYYSTDKKRSSIRKPSIYDRLYHLLTLELQLQYLEAFRLGKPLIDRTADNFRRSM